MTRDRKGQLRTADGGRVCEGCGAIRRKYLLPVVLFARDQDQHVGPSGVAWVCSDCVDGWGKRHGSDALDFLREVAALWLRRKLGEP